MDWVEDFYTKQEAWSGVYTSDVTDYHRRKASLVRSMAGDAPQSVLELGAGGGQTAYATAEMGCQVTAVELLPAPAAHATRLSERLGSGLLRIIQADFYTVHLDASYDLVCYWDGFGIGQDEDQVRLLKRIARWVKPTGAVLLDIYSPWYWALAAGREMVFGTVARRYGFDPEGNRMIDSWWPIGREQDRVSQSLRCYTPADLKLLLRSTGLRLVDDATIPGGSVDYDRGTYQERAALNECMSYTVKLVPEERARVRAALQHA